MFYVTVSANPIVQHAIQIKKWNISSCQDSIQTSVGTKKLRIVSI